MPGHLFLDRMSHPIMALTVCQSLLILSVGWTAYALAFSLPYWPVDPWLSLSPLFNFQLDLVRCVWAILPATLLWGASFPLALAAAAEPGEDPARLSGEVYAANTAGSVVGAVSFSLFLIPGLGTRGAQQVLLAISAAGAVAAGIAAMRIPKIRRTAVALVVPAIVCSTAIIFSVEMYRGKSLPTGGVSPPRCGAADLYPDAAATNVLFRGRDQFVYCHCRPGRIASVLRERQSRGIKRSSRHASGTDDGSHPGSDPSESALGPYSRVRRWCHGGVFRSLS